MAEITIRLIYNLDSGKKDIYIDFESEDDALPIEHERGHRKIMADLFEKNVLTEDEAGEIIVRRLEPGSAGPEQQADTAPPEQQAQGS